ATKSQAELRFDSAAASLYQLLLEQPRAREAAAARLQLARLLALSGDFPAAILQCQALRDEVTDPPIRQTAIDLAPTLARPLRAGAAINAFTSTNVTTPKGLTSLDEPAAIVFHSSGSYLLVDTGNGKTMRVTGEGATLLPSTDQIQAATFLPDAT